MRESLFPPPASRQNGTYPRPQLLRSSWTDLSGQWRFQFDDADEGRDRGWIDDPGAFTRSIVVPFPPESVASGVGETGFHRVMWYRRTVTSAEIAAAGHRPGRRLLLHFAAVDYRADVWIAGVYAGGHEGGHTPFCVEVRDGGEEFDIVVRVEDDPEDIGQPRGKQDWAAEPHVVWYDRTSGIWQPVWLESVPAQHIARLSWRADAHSASARLAIDLAERPATGTRLRVALRAGDDLLAEQATLVTGITATVILTIDALRNGQALADHLWSPEHPNLIDAELELEAPGQEPDRVCSYLGVREVGADEGRFLLNGRPHLIRGVLAQGYWPESHLAAPSAAALRKEVELIKDLGFTTVRMHQKIEDPRFLYWADRLGVLVWEEMPSVYEFSETAAGRLIREWSDVVHRDGSHPSIVAWVPFNESWGVQHVATSARQQHLVRTLYHLTKTLDDTRLVISNDGWEHIRSDLLTVHDYENDPARLLRAYGTPEATRTTLAGIAPNGRRMLVGTAEEAASTEPRPVILSEFGGVSVEPQGPGAWGYRLVATREDLEEHLGALFRAVQQSTGLAGWCFTQLTDTAQETNGLADEARIPKIPVERIRAIVGEPRESRPAEPVFGIDPAHASPGRT